MRDIIVYMQPREWGKTDMAVEVERRPFSTAEYHRMAQVGILNEDDRVELIHGEVITMSPAGPARSACVKRINAILHARIGRSAIVSIQDPISLDTGSEPQPDIALLMPRDDYYSKRLPAPSEVLLVIEVADTSAGYDRNVKLPLYAGAGIPEVWLVGLPEKRVEAYSQPKDGSYQSVRRVGRGTALSPEGVPVVALTVDEIFG